MKKAIILFIALLNLSCAGIKIETGQTAEEATETSAEQASRIRSEWADYLSRTDLKERPEQLAEIVKRTMGTYRHYGQQILNQWQEGERGRGQTVSSGEMRSMIEQWLAPQQPILKAYEDMFEYTYEQLKKEYPNNQRLLDAAKKLSDFFYNAYPGFFYPTGTVEDYRYNIESNSTETGQALEDYRFSFPE